MWDKVIKSGLWVPAAEPAGAKAEQAEQADSDADDEGAADDEMETPDWDERIGLKDRKC